jgi:hypothetical protein
MSRLYTLYARFPGGSFSVRSITYSRGTHPWIYRVFASSVRQAYRLAARGVWARDDHSVGVREVMTRDAAPERAPYLIDRSGER